jgi:hypothetical protein
MVCPSAVAGAFNFAAQLGHSTIGMACPPDRRFNPLPLLWTAPCWPLANPNLTLQNAFQLGSVTLASDSVASHTWGVPPPSQFQLVGKTQEAHRQCPPRRREPEDTRQTICTGRRGRARPTSAGLLTDFDPYPRVRPKSQKRNRFRLWLQKMTDKCRSAENQKLTRFSVPILRTGFPCVLSESDNQAATAVKAPEFGRWNSERFLALL